MHDTQRSGRLFEESSDSASIFGPLRDQILAANRVGRALLIYTREELLATPI